MGKTYAVLLWAISISFGIGAFSLIAYHVPDPYLDEIFHIPQTYQYCQGHFSHWDSKITTPPGLYLMGYAWAKLLNHDCSVILLRSLNAFGGYIILPLVLGVMSSNVYFGIVVSNVPIVWFFSNLYYTDVWSTILIFGSMSVNQLGPWVGAILAALSITFRQTNIIWAAFSAGHLLLKHQVQNNKEIDEKKVKSTCRQIYSLLWTAIKNPNIIISYGMVGLLFGIFIYFNGGITLGDKENHTVGIHGAQILYFILFTIFFSWPFWISVSLIEKYFKRLIVKWYLVAFELLAIILVIEKLTIVHPFILADNRHYTFYLWRRLIQPTWSLNAKYQMVPVYHFGIWVFISCLASSTNFLTAVLFIACTLATLIPSPLLEPRYYIVPYILWRMLIVKSSPKTSKFRIMAEIAWNAFVNFITVYMFVYKPFEWSQEPGALQRFMW